MTFASILFVFLLCKVVGVGSGQVRNHSPELRRQGVQRRDEGAPFVRGGSQNVSKEVFKALLLRNNNLHRSLAGSEPFLVDVELPADISTNVTCKSVIGMVSPGEYYFMVASDGDYLSDVTYADMQKILLDKSCTFAQSLSTGVNVVMSMQGELINQPAVGTGRLQYEYIVVTD